MSQQEFKKSFHLNLQETTGLTVYNTGNHQCPPNHNIGPFVKNFYLLHYVLSGEGVFICNDKKYEITENQAFLIYPETLNRYTASTDNPWEYSWVAFDGADAKRLLEHTDFSKENPIIVVPKSANLQEHIKKIYDTADGGINEEIEMVGYLYLLLSSLVKVSNKPEDKSPYGNKHIKMALKYIHNNFSGTMSVNSIANYVGISASYLYRLFIKTQGVSPSDYLIEYRIDHASMLLRTGKYTIGEVANSVGYEDQLYFSRMFKKIKGIPPSTYMNKYLE